MTVVAHQAAAELERRRRAAQARAESITLREFVKEAWHVVEPSVQLVWGRHLDAIIEHLQAVTDGEIRRLKINVPPGHMKSLLVGVFWPSWMWLRAPHERYLATSHTATLAMRDAIKMRDVVRSEWYQRTFRPDWRLRGDIDAKGRFANTVQGERYSTGLTGTITGFRGDGIIIDDPLSATDAHSEAVRTETNRVIRETLSNRLNDPASSWMVSIMQRLHEDDPCGMWDDLGGWETLCLPSEYDDELARKYHPTCIGGGDWRTTSGALLFPERFTSAVLESDRTILGSQGYAAQHGQRPAPAEGLLFRREWFTLVDRGDMPLPGEVREKAISVDASFGSEKDTASRVAIGLWWRHQGRVYRVAERVEAMSYTRTRAALVDFWQRHGQPDVYIENKANGPALISDLRETIPVIIPIETGSRDKQSRAHAVTPFVESGAVHLPRGAAWVDEWLHEVTQFPRGRHDDRVDEMVQLLARWKTPPPTFAESPSRRQHGARVDRRDLLLGRR